MEKYFEMTDEEIREKLSEDKRNAIRGRRQRARRRRIIAMCVAVALAAGAGCALGRVIGKGANRSYLKSRMTVVRVAEDLPRVNTAKAEIGNEGGEKFWSWYGYGSHVSWCACFASWCCDQVGLIDEEKAPKFSYVPDGANWFSDRGRWIEPGETPEAGDLIFFDWEPDGGRDHVGIVAAVVDGKVFTIEGNSSERCRMKRYELDDPVIYGYGHIEQSEKTDSEQ